MRIRPAATFALPILLAGLLFAAAAPSPAAAGTKPCWERVIDDWLNNKPIEGYSSKCLQQALKNVPEDLRDYSNVTDAIAAALDNSLHPGANGGSPGSPGSTGGGGQNPAGKDRRLQSAPPQSYYRRAVDNLGTTSADSLPVPLLVLAGLGTLLLLSAGALAARKRLKARSAPPRA